MKYETKNWMLLVAFSVLCSLSVILFFIYTFVPNKIILFSIVSFYSLLLLAICFWVARNDLKDRFAFSGIAIGFALMPLPMSWEQRIDYYAQALWMGLFVFTLYFSFKKMFEHLFFNNK